VSVYSADENHGVSIQTRALGTMRIRVRAKPMLELGFPKRGTRASNYTRSIPSDFPLSSPNVA